MYLASCFLIGQDNQTTLAILLMILEIYNNFFQKRKQRINKSIYPCHEL